MDQSTKKVGLMNWVILLPAVIFMLLIARHVNSDAGLVAALLAGFGFLVALISYFYMALLQREQLEKLELEELSKSRGSDSLFATAGEDTFPAKRSREIFERFLIPAFTIVLFCLQVAGAYFGWRWIDPTTPVDPQRAALGMSLLGLMGLILFLLGKYSTGLARLRAQPLLRAGASYMLLSAYACFAVVLGIALGIAGFQNADETVARILCVIIGLISVETLVGLIFEVYRVRVRGSEARVLFESRLVGLFGQPEAIFTTAAQTLDYQFGFKVSETWFFKFFKDAIVWLVLVQVVILILSTCVVVVQSGDQALLERFGAPLGENGVIGPGLHFKLPWPVDQTTNYHTEQIQTFVVGADADTSSTIVWKIAHAREENFLVASRGRAVVQITNDVSLGKSPPVNLLSVSIPVQYQITNLAAWAYINHDPESLLKELALREVVKYLASADFDEVMSRGRQAAGNSLRQTMQAAADRLQLGAKITFVGLEDIHPPSKVAEVFENIVGSAQTKEAKILDARAYEFTTNGWANAESSNRVWAAEADQHRAMVTSTARAQLFTNQVLAYSAAPGKNGVYEERALLDTWVTGSQQTRKYVIGTTNTPDVLIFDLIDKTRRDLIDDLSAPSKK